MSDNTKSHKHDIPAMSGKGDNTKSADPLPWRDDTFGPNPRWREFGSSASSSGVAWSFDRDELNEGRFRVTYTERGKPTVRHTFDMRERLAKRLAAPTQEGN